MTDSSTTTTSAPPAKPYNFALGALASLLAIPLTAILTIIVGQVGFEYAGMLGGLGMVFAFTFFGSASRRRTVRCFGFAFALLVGLIAMALGIVAGFVSSVYYSFNAVGGKGGLLGDVFIGRIVFRLTERPEDFFIPAAVSVFIAIVLLVKYLKTAIATTGAPVEIGGPGAPAAVETSIPSMPGAVDAAAPTVNAP